MKQYDVFISYSHIDSVWVREELIPRLEQRGFRVFVDFINFRTGSPGIEEMQRGVVESKRTLLVLSPNYMKSGWGQFENMMVQNLDPAATLRIMIPAMLEKCDLPLRLSMLHYRNLIDNNEQEWELLMRDLM